MFRLFQQRPDWEKNVDRYIQEYARELRDKWGDALDGTAPGVYLQLSFLLGTEMLYEFISASLKKDANRSRIANEIQQLMPYEVRRVFHGVLLYHAASISHQTTKRSIGEDVLSMIEHELSNEEKKWFNDKMAKVPENEDETARYILKLLGYGESANRPEHIALFMKRIGQTTQQMKKGFDNMLDDFDLRDRYYDE